MGLIRAVRGMRVVGRGRYFQPPEQFQIFLRTLATSSGEAARRLGTAHHPNLCITRVLSCQQFIARKKRRFPSGPGGERGTSPERSGGKTKNGTETPTLLRNREGFSTRGKASEKAAAPAPRHQTPSRTLVKYCACQK